MQDLKSFHLPRNFREKSIVVVQIWMIIQNTLFNHSPVFMYGWRRWLLRVFGAKIGTGVLIRPSVKITYPWKISIGDFSWIGDDVVLYSLGNIIIGKNTVVSQRSYLCSASHDYGQSSFPVYVKTINIGNEAWLATDVFIAPGVSIGFGAVVGARSSVFCDLPDMMICVGTPAKPIKPRIIG